MHDYTYTVLLCEFLLLYFTSCVSEMICQLTKYGFGDADVYLRLPVRWPL